MYHYEKSSYPCQKPPRYGWAAALGWHGLTWSENHIRHWYKSPPGFAGEEAHKKPGIEGYSHLLALFFYQASVNHPLYKLLGKIQQAGTNYLPIIIIACFSLIMKAPHIMKAPANSLRN